MCEYVWTALEIMEAVLIKNQIVKNMKAIQHFLPTAVRIS